MRGRRAHNVWVVGSVRQRFYTRGEERQDVTQAAARLGAQSEGPANRSQVVERFAGKALTSRRRGFARQACLLRVPG